MFEQENKGKKSTGLDGVKVHYNSSRPAHMQALAYTQGDNVYVGPGQERHLAHELGHVVQQREGRVRATGTLNGQPINTDAGLEREATKIGERVIKDFG